MENICEIRRKVEGHECVHFNENFNQELTPDIIEFLSKYQKVRFGSDFNQSIDKDSPTGKSSSLPNSLTKIIEVQHPQ